MEKPATNNGNGSDDRRIDDAPFNFMDDPIQEMINEGDHDEPEAEGGGGGDKKDEGSVSPALQARLDQMNESQEELKQTVQFLKGQNSILENQLRGGDKKEKEPDEKPLLSIDREKIGAALANSDTALDTLVGMFESFGKNIIERVNKVQDESRGELSRRDQHERWKSEMAQDRQEAIDEFGEEIIGSKEFIAEADKEMARTISRRGGKTLRDIQPGDFSAVAARVYARWLREGKIGENRGNSRDSREDRRPTLRELNREISSSDRLGDGNGPRGGGGKTSMRDLYSSEKEYRIADSARRKMGVSEEAWVKNYRAGQAEDEGYGR